METGNRQRFSSPRMSKLDAVPENHSYEAVIEQQQQDAFDDGSPRRMPHPVPVRGASFSAKPIRRQLSIDSQMSASVRKMTPAELPTSRCVFLSVRQSALIDMTAILITCCMWSLSASRLQ